jgi:AcrR family transcriptional regulator
VTPAGARPTGGTDDDAAGGEERPVGVIDLSDDADGGARLRILDAAVVTAGRTGLDRLTVEEVARQAGLARATVYRHFPGGREEVVSEAVAHEVSRYFTTLALHLQALPDLASRLEEGIVRGRSLLAEHEVFQKVVDAEPERLLPHLSQSAPLVLDAVRTYLRPLLDDADLADGVDPDEAAEWLARNVLSFLMAAGQWDLDDRTEVRRLVREQILAGVVRGGADTG